MIEYQRFSALKEPPRARVQLFVLHDRAVGRTSPRLLHLLGSYTVLRAAGER